MREWWQSQPLERWLTAAASLALMIGAGRILWTVFHHALACIVTVTQGVGR